jgi:hypothetical protein
MKVEIQRIKIFVALTIRLPFCFSDDVGTWY